MFKSGKIKYVIKSVPSEDTMALQNLLNEMSDEGWDLYSMHEAENDDGFYFNCIFVTNSEKSEVEDVDDVINISSFKTQMEKMLTVQPSPYESCREIQIKIRDVKDKIAEIKNRLEKEAPASEVRKKCNSEISRGMKELENLRQELILSISPEQMYSKVTQEKLSIRLSEEILDFVNFDGDEDLLSQTVKVRQKLAEEIGYVIPKVMFQDDDSLSPYEFSIQIRGLDVFNAFVYPNYLVFELDELNLGKKQKDCIYCQDNLSGKKLVWVPKEKTKNFWQKGRTPSEYIADVLEYVAVKHVDELFDYNDVNRYIDIVMQKNQFVVENIIPDFISVAELKYILANLIRERVSIKDIVYIFEKINDFADEACKEDLLDKIRLSLSRQITKHLINQDGEVVALELLDKTSDRIFGDIADGDSIVRIDGTKIEKLVTKILKLASQNEMNRLILVAPMSVRHMLSIVLGEYINVIDVIAREEVAGHCSLEIIGEV